MPNCDGLVENTAGWGKKAGKLQDASNTFSVWNVSKDIHIVCRFSFLWGVQDKFKMKQPGVFSSSVPFTLGTN